MASDVQAEMPGLGDDPPEVVACSRKRRMLGAEDHISFRRKIGELALAGEFESLDRRPLKGRPLSTPSTATVAAPGARPSGPAWTGRSISIR